MWLYWLEDESGRRIVTGRKTKPRMGSVITYEGRKWEVWYIEEGAGVQNARCEPLTIIDHP